MIQLGDSIRLSKEEVAYFTALNDGQPVTLDTVQGLYASLKGVAVQLHLGEDDEARQARRREIWRLLPEGVPQAVWEGILDAQLTEEDGTWEEVLAKMQSWLKP